MNRKSFGAWVSEGLEDPVEIVRGLIPAVGCGFIAGVPKCGKTWGILDLALAVTTGQSFLGRETKQTAGPAYYMTGEGGVSRLLQRVAWLANGRGLSLDEIGDRIHLSVSPRILLDRPEGLEALEEDIKIVKPSLLIIDPLTRFHSADENSRTQIDVPLLTPLRQISEEYELCIIIVHHAAKWYRGRFDPLRGTSAFAGWYDFLLYYEPMVQLGKGNDDEDQDGGEICGYKFGASLRDNEEPPKREIFLEIDEPAKKAQVYLAQSGSSCSTTAFPTLRKQILYILNSEGATSQSKIRKILNRSSKDVKLVLEGLISAELIEEFSESGLKLYRSLQV